MVSQPSNAEWVTIETEETITVIEEVEVPTTVTTKVLTPAQSENLSPNISNYSTSGDASTNKKQGTYCKIGDACTGFQGGTFSTSIDLESEMSVSSINEGFDLNYGVTAKSHNSNTRLPTCDLTNGDCKDTVSVTMTLKDGNSVVHQYQNDYVLDYGGTRNYTFTEKIPTNTYSGLIAELELYGIDAGYTKGMYGPIFSDPYINVTYDIISFVNETVINIVQQEVEKTIIVYEQMWIPEPEVIEETNEEVLVDVIDISVDTGSGEVVEMSFDIDINSTGDVTIEVETIDEFGVAEVETIAEIEIASAEMSVEVAEVEITDAIEAEVEINEIETTEMESVSQAESETEVQEVSNESEQSSEEGNTEAIQESSSDAEEQVDNGQNDKPSNEENRGSSNAGKTRLTKTEVKQKIQNAKQKIAAKIMSTITNNYDVSAQNTQIALMTALTDTQSFKEYQSQSLIDIEGFFTETKIPDSIISDNNLGAYFMFGGSDIQMNNLIESQYK